MRNSHQHSTDPAHKEAPLSFEHTLKLRNEPDRDLPGPIKRELSLPRIYLRGIPHRRDVGDYLTAREDIGYLVDQTAQRSERRSAGTNRRAAGSRLGHGWRGSIHRPSSASVVGRLLPASRRPTV